MVCPTKGHAGSILAGEHILFKIYRTRSLIVLINTVKNKLLFIIRVSTISGKIWGWRVTFFRTSSNESQVYVDATTDAHEREGKFRILNFNYVLFIHVFGV